MIVDFVKPRTNSNSISTMGEEVEVVEEYKHLSVHKQTGLQMQQ